jgi:hypothetical protein
VHLVGFGDRRKGHHLPRLLPEHGGAIAEFW